MQRRGGAFLGVGTDLNYTLSGWARAELVVIVDFDQAVIDLHRAYLGVLEHCETPAEFVAAWCAAERDATTELLRRRWADDPRRADIVRAFRTAQPMVTNRLGVVRRGLRAHALGSFTDDAAEYAHVRTLANNHRIVVVRGDYGGETTLLAVGAALRSARLQLGVVYLSNVEQYLDYTPSFRRNFLALDLDRAAVVLRTMSRRVLGHAPGERYHYNVQPAAAFADWLRDGDVPRLRDLLRFRTETLESGLSSLDRPSPALADE